MGRGGWTLTTEQKEAISRFMKGLVKAPPTYTEESMARKSRKATASMKNIWANMTPEEREARCAKMRHKHNVSEEGRKKLSELSKVTIRQTIAAGKFKGSHNKSLKETKSMMTTTNEVSAYIDQLKAKARLFAATFEKQPIENLVKIDAFLNMMLPGNTEVTANVGTVTGSFEPVQPKRKSRRGGGLTKYKEPFAAYKSNGGKLKWHEWLKFAKTGVFPSPLDPVPQNQQVIQMQ